MHGLFHRAKMAVDQGQSAVKFGHHGLPVADGVGVAVKRNHPHTLMAEHGARIAACAECAVEINPALTQL